jgi:hypothetical protein
MKLKLKRFHDDGKGTLGILFVDGVFECFTCEDTYRERKVQGETRIPAGTYWIDFRNIDSPKTRRYRVNYNWFTYHLHIKGVKDFKYVYIHIGNNATHSEGCILVGRQANKSGEEGPEVLKSKIAFKPLYQKIQKALQNGEGVQIKIEDNP